MQNHPKNHNKASNQSINGSIANEITKSINQSISGLGVQTNDVCPPSICFRKADPPPANSDGEPSRTDHRTMAGKLSKSAWPQNMQRDWETSPPIAGIVSLKEPTKCRYCGTHACQTQALFKPYLLVSTSLTCHLSNEIKSQLVRKLSRFIILRDTEKNGWLSFSHSPHWQHTVGPRLKIDRSCHNLKRKKASFFPRMI